MSRSRLQLPRIVLLAVLLSGCAEANNPKSADFAAWVSEEAIPLESLTAPLSAGATRTLQTAIGSARLIGIGESRHDTREQLLMKSLLVRTLIERSQFRVLILEESVPHVIALDRYVTQGEGELSELMNELAGWYLWDTEEMQATIAWVRRYNRTREPTDMVRIFGMDITAPLPGVREVLARLEAAGVPSPVDAHSLRLGLQEGDDWLQTQQRYAALPATERAELARSYDRLIETLTRHQDEVVESSSESEYRQALSFAEVGRAGNAFFSSHDLREGGKIRERAMADIALEIVHEVQSGKKAIIWAHNLHVAKGPFSMPALGEGTFGPMGVHLHDELGAQYLAIGGTFGNGGYGASLPPGERVFEIQEETVIDGALARVGLEHFWIDLRTAPDGGPAERWLHQNREWVAQDAAARLVPGQAFDLVYFVEQITRSQPSSRSLLRFRDG